jgi:hypothetical protein
MHQIERSKLITYRWWRDGENDIKPEHVPALEERADEQIAEMMAKGCTSGELNITIHMTDGVEYRGWWEITTTAKKTERKPLPWFPPRGRRPWL